MSGTDDMTAAKCAASCANYAYFGTEWNRECFCGNSLTDGSAPVLETECDHPCTGDATEMCGGSRRLSLYQNPDFVAPGQPATVGSYSFYGCVVDAVSDRTLKGADTGSASMTLEACATFCAGYTYFGTEYARECFCGNTLPADLVQAASSDCSMTCTGNSLQFCGNGDRLSLYQLT